MRTEQASVAPPGAGAPVGLRAAGQVPGPEARETSGATTGGLLRYVRTHGGEDAVARVLASAGLPYTAEELDDQSRWWSYETRIRLFAAATSVLDEPDTMYRVGAAALQSGLAHSLVLLLRAMGTPRQVFRQLPRAVAKFSTTSTMEVLSSGATSATISFRLHEGYAHSRLDCRYAQGLISTVPTIFGLAPAHIVHDECESDGSPACVYRLTWERRRRLPGRRRRASTAVDLELTALRGQLRTLQSAASDLVASDDLDSALHRIVARAAEAVLAPAYLLAVAAPDGGAPLVHSAGVPVEEVPGLAARLLDGGDLGPGAVVVDVASTRRRHGRLAALYRPGSGAMGDEHSLLAAYAGHAAAALDLLIALEGARLEAERAGALLALAHELATATNAAAVAEVVVQSLPRVVGCSSAGIFLWNAGEGRLLPQASVGLDDERTAHLLGLTIAPEDTPELLGMLGDQEPRVLTATGSSDGIRRLLGALGLTDVVAVPLLAGATFLGIATASWNSGDAVDRVGDDALARLQGVGDQASTALQKARLLETVRHQATHDALTGLPNRVLFLEVLEETLAAGGSASAAPFAVLFCDLDRFKEVNDTLGHAAGDELLRQVAARLRSGVRPGDTVGRLSGDEFAVLLPGLENPGEAQAQALAQRVTACFAQPFRIEGREVPIMTSIGIAVHDPGTAATATDLLRRADAAMYRHKHGGRPAVPTPR